MLYVSLRYEIRDLFVEFAVVVKGTGRHVWGMSPHTRVSSVAAEVAKSRSLHLRGFTLEQNNLSKLSFVREKSAR